MIHNTSWPYANETGITEKLNCDVLVLGGGLAGCYAAIAAARRGQSVILVEKGAVERSGSAGTGFDHWESACTNPCSGVTPEEIAWAYVNEQDYYSNGIAHYIECREGYDRMLDMESFGGKIRDTKNEFEGAAFRDEKTKLMFAYDYKNKFTLRVWGSTFKPSLYKELKRLGVKLLEHTEATALLTSFVNGKKHGAGACAMDVHTCKFYILRAKSTVLAMSRPARVWLFDADQPGLCEFRPFQSIGSGHAMGWRSGIEFTMMEKSVRAEYSAAGRSFPAYGTGNNHNTWYAATMVDARGVEIPYVDRDGKELTSVLERYYPAPGQKFFLKGGVIDNPKYEYRGPETLDFDELIKRGYQLPFYADLSRMPDEERRVIWGMMVGEEGRRKSRFCKIIRSVALIRQRICCKATVLDGSLLTSLSRSASSSVHRAAFFTTGISRQTLMASMLPVISFMHLTAPDLPVQQVTMPGEKLLPVQSPVSFHLTIQRKRPASRPVCTHRSLSKMESTGRN